MVRKAKADQRTKASRTRGNGSGRGNLLLRGRTNNRQQDTVTSVVAQVTWQQTVLRKFIATEHAIVADSKVTLPQIDQVKEREGDIKGGNIPVVIAVSRKGKENPPENHHHSKGIVIILGSTGTNVRTAGNFTRWTMTSNGKGSMMMKKNQILVESCHKMPRKILKIVRFYMVSRVTQEDRQSKIVGIIFRPSQAFQGTSPRSTKITILPFVKNLTLKNGDWTNRMYSL